MPTPSEGGSWGILGGAFDPVHIGHLEIARQCQKLKALDGVLFVPSYAHPFKGAQSVASYDDRVVMLRLALKDHGYFQTCIIESEQNLSGYSLDTIKALKDRYPTASFQFIIGADNLADLHRWKNPLELLNRVKFLVAARPGFIPELPEGIPADRLELLTTDLNSVSSSEIRREIMADKSADRWTSHVPPGVADYITSRGIYR